MRKLLQPGPHPTIVAMTVACLLVACTAARRAGDIDDDNAESTHSAQTGDDGGGAGSDDSDPDCSAGEVGCRCDDDGRCHDGLSCLSELCVDARDLNAAGVSDNTDDAEPGSSEPGTAEPDAAEPDAAEPDAAEPNAAKPNAAEPTAEPDAAEPSVAEPGAAEPVDDAEPSQNTEPSAPPSEPDANVEPSAEPIATPEPAAEPTPIAEPVASPEPSVNNNLDPSIIDNFVTCDGEINAVAGRSGEWYSWADNGVNLDFSVRTPPSGWSNQSCGAVAIGGALESGATDSMGIGLILAGGSGYDLSAYSGLTINIESGDPLYVVIKTLEGGLFGAELTATSGSQTFNVPFSSMAAWAISTTEVLDRTQITEVQFVPQDLPFGFAVHLVALY